MNTTASFNTFSAIIGAIASIVYGTIDGLLIAFIIAIVLDYVSGVISAIINKKLNSEISVKGLLRKFLLILIVVTANVIDVVLLKSGGVLRNSILSLLIANECISILENCGKAGVPIPKKIVNILQQLKKDDESGGKK